MTEEEYNNQFNHYRTCRRDDECAETRERGNVMDFVRFPRNVHSGGVLHGMRRCGGAVLNSILHFKYQGPIDQSVAPCQAEPC